MSEIARDALRCRLRLRAMFVFIIAGAAGILIHLGTWPELSFSLWVVAIVLAGSLVPRGEQPAERFQRIDWLYLAGLTVIAAFFRLYRIGDLPYGMWLDEVAMADAADRLLQGRFAPFGTSPLFPGLPQFGEEPNAYLYFASLVRWGQDPRMGIKLVSVLPGIAAVPLTFWAGRAFLSRGSSAVAAGLLAVSAWHVTLSRWGWFEVLATALFIASVGCLVRAISRDDRRWAWICGVLAGLALYTYLASRIALVVLLAVFSVRMLFWRSRTFPLMSAFIFAVVLTSFPLVIHAAQAGNALTARMSAVSVIRDNDLRPAIDNLGRYLLMFHVAGDRNPRHNVPGRPMLEIVPGVLFLAGIATMVFHLRRVAAHSLLLILGLSLVAAATTSDAPHAYRTGFLAPVCFLIAAYPLDQLSLLESRRKMAIASLAILFLAGIQSFHIYFRLRDDCRKCWLSNREGALAYFARPCMQRVLAAGAAALIDKRFQRPEWMFEVRTLIEDLGPDTPLAWVEPDRVPAAVLDRSVMFVQARPAASAIDSSGMRAQTLENRFGDGIVTALSRNDELLRRLNGGDC